MTFGDPQTFYTIITLNILWQNPVYKPNMSFKENIRLSHKIKFGLWAGFYGSADIEISWPLNFVKPQRFPELQ